MKKSIVGFLLLLGALLLAACSSSSDSGVVPAVDRPTFAFFYTEG